MYLYRLLLAIYLLGVLGVAGELLLLGHYEDAPQLIPFAVMALGVVTVLVWARSPGRASLLCYQGSLLLFAASGLAGLVLHYKGNVEFEMEMDPALHGFALFREAVTGATPAMAPGTMLLIGAVGYAAIVARRSIARQHDQTAADPRPTG